MARKDRGLDVPDSIKGNDDAQAFFGILNGTLRTTDGQELSSEDRALISLAIIRIVQEHHIVGVWSNNVAQNKMRNAIDDYFFDVVRDEKDVEFPVEALDGLESRIMSVARARFPD